MIVQGREIEILAPSGDFDCLKAALRAGADSVYFGMGDFNARRNASNFDTDDKVKQAVDYCHIRGKKAHLTLNTLLYDNEIKSLDIEKIASFNFDAIIVQDLGVVNLLKKNTDIPLHASTQLSAHNISEVKELEDLGFDRVVLAREMSFKEIERVINNTDVEIEVFIHGALCMCVSGQCYFSSALGNRSGNRGLCAGVCRLPFYVKNKGNYDLSLKDLSHIDYIKELVDIGVKSFKIEGRMKSKEYVYTVVNEIVKSIDGEYDKEILKKAFSRNGFTDGYYTGKRKNMFGTKSEKSETDIILKETEDKSKIGTTMKYYMVNGESSKMTLIDCDGNEASAVGSIPSEARNAPLTKEKVERNLLKLNDTAYKAEKIEGELSENVFLSAKDINRLRRECVAKLDEIRSWKEHIFHSRKTKLISKEFSKKENIALFSNLKDITNNASSFFDKIFVPLFQVEKLAKTDSDKYGVILPRVYFDDEEKITKYLKIARGKGIKYAYCNGLGKASLAKGQGFKVYLGYGNNITNSYGIDFINENVQGVKNITLSFENTFKNINKLISPIPLSVIVYGNIPLMITRNCPIKNEITCNECKKSSYLTDRKGKKFRVKCENGLSNIYNSVTTCVFDRLDKLNDNISNVFMFNLDDDMNNVIKSFNEKVNVASFTRGCYFRKLD